MSANDLFEKVTADLVAAIEEGAKGWRMPWQQLAVGGTPRSIDGQPYRGWNALVLAMTASDRGWSSTWATYRGWQRHNCQVRRGECGTQVVLWKPTQRKDQETSEDETGRSRSSLLARTFTVFAAEQVEGGDRVLTPRIDLPESERLAAADAYFSATGSRLVLGGNRACYVPALDQIHLPAFDQFDRLSDFYSTSAHDPLTAPTERFDHHLGPARRCDQVALERRRMWLDRRRRGHPGRWGIWSSRVSVVSNVATINPVFDCSMRPGCR